MKLSNKPYFFAALLAFLLALAYGHTLQFSFQFDDYNVIIDEPKVHSLSAWWQSMLGMRPLLKLSYALNWQLEQAPRFFRLFNLSCHFLTSILVWKFSLKILPFLKVTAQHHQAIALLTALLFALHPAHSEVITYISSRSTGLMVLLCMVSLLFSLSAILPKNGLKPAYLIASVFCWILAILVKEPAMVLPVLAWLLVKLRYPSTNIYESFKALSGFKKVFILAVFTLPIVYICQIDQYSSLLMQVFSTDNLHSQLLNQPVAHMHYLTQTLLGLNLNVDYQLDFSKTLNMQICLQASWILACGGMALYYFKRFPLICFCMLWWFVCLLPSNSIIPRPDIVNDRQIYMASIGALLLLATAIVKLTHYLNMQRFFLVIVSVILMGNVVATRMRNWDYETEVTLWQSSVNKAPTNARAWNNLGYAYKLSKHNQKAKQAFENALKFDANNEKAFYNLQELN